MVKVFLVEDEFVVREGIKNNINWQANGYDFCGEASDGEVAYSMIQKLQPDILITDIKMPFMDGHQLTKLIKNDDVYSKKPVVIFSSIINEDMKKKGESVGANAQLTKPDIGSLVRTIDELILEFSTTLPALVESDEYKAALSIIRQRYKSKKEEYITG